MSESVYYSYEIEEEPHVHFLGPLFTVTVYKETPENPYRAKKFETTLYANTLKRAHKKAKRWIEREKNRKIVGCGSVEIHT